MSNLKNLDACLFKPERDTSLFSSMTHHFVVMFGGSVLIFQMRDVAIL